MVPLVNQTFFPLHCCCLLFSVFQFIYWHVLNLPVDNCVPQETCRNIVPWKPNYRLAVTPCTFVTGRQVLSPAASLNFDNGSSVHVQFQWHLWPCAAWQRVADLLGHPFQLYCCSLFCLQRVGYLHSTESRLFYNVRTLEISNKFKHRWHIDGVGVHSGKITKFKKSTVALDYKPEARSIGHWVKLI